MREFTAIVLTDREKIILTDAVNRLAHKDFTVSPKRKGDGFGSLMGLDNETIKTTNRRLAWMSNVKGFRSKQRWVLHASIIELVVDKIMHADQNNNYSLEELQAFSHKLSKIK